MSRCLPLLALLLSTACASQAASSGARPAAGEAAKRAPAAPPDRVQVAIDKAVSRGLPGVVIHLHGPVRDTTLVGGFSDRRTRRAMRPDHLFRVASNSKTYLAIVAAEMHVDGLLDLDAPVSRYLPKRLVQRIANLDKATLRQLLNHTSGVPEYLNDQFALAASDEPTRVFSAEDVLTFAEGIDADFAPGTQWKYSNTNYVVAGLAIDAVAGHHHALEIRKRVLDPLGLRKTSYWRKEPMVGELARGYVGQGSTEKDVTDFDFARGLADGGMIASAADLARFVEAVGNDREGGPFPIAAREELFRDMVKTKPGGYGLGIQVFELGDHGEIAIGHGGTLVGYRSEMFYIPDMGVSVAIAANRSQPTQVFDDLVVEVLLSLLEKQK